MATTTWSRNLEKSLTLDKLVSLEGLSEYPEFADHLTTAKQYLFASDPLLYEDDEATGDLDQRMVQYLHEARDAYRQMKDSCARTDKIDKVLGLADILFDLTTPIGGIVLSTVKELIELPLKINAMWQCYGVTRDGKTLAKDVGYELVSMLPGGCVLDLVARYSTRVDDIVAQQAAAKYTALHGDGGVADVPFEDEVIA